MIAWLSEWAEQSWPRPCPTRLLMILVLGLACLLGARFAMVMDSCIVGPLQVFILATVTMCLFSIFTASTAKYIMFQGDKTSSSNSKCCYLTQRNLSDLGNLSNKNSITCVYIVIILVKG